MNLTKVIRAVVIADLAIVSILLMWYIGDWKFLFGHLTGLLIGATYGAIIIRKGEKHG